MTLPRLSRRCLAGVALAMAAAVSADEGRKPGQEPATGWTVLDRHPGRGEQCLVCGHAIHGLEVVEIRHQGRSFHVAGPMLGELMNDPDRYFSRVQARAALFDEAAVRALPIGRGWLAVGTYLVAGLVCGALCAYLAVGRARPALPWFFAGLAGNVLALAAVLAGRRGDLSALPAGVPRGLAKVPTTRAAEPCPACGNPHHPSSRRCPACGLGLTPTVRAETELV